MDVTPFCEPKDWVIATLASPALKGEHGLFWMARCFKSKDNWLLPGTELTFDEEALNGARAPSPGTPGTTLVLSDCEHKSKGWRSHSVERFGKDHQLTEGMKLSPSEQEELKQGRL